MRSAALPAAAAVAILVYAGLTGCALNAAYDKYAIVYGISIYDTGKAEGSSPNLTYPNDDAIAMAALLSAQGYQVWLQTDTGAIKSNLETLDVPAVAAVAQEEDLFVFYYSGHGGQGSSGAENVGSDGPNEWIFLHNSITPAGAAVYSETFSDDQLVAAFAPIAARKKVIILDSCNSGGFIGNELEADGEPSSLLEVSESYAAQAARAIRLYANFDNSAADIPPWVALVLSAAGERELSYEMGWPYDHGVFTYYLLEAERKGDANRDGWVTATEAFAYTQGMIYRDWNYGFGFPWAVFSPHVSGGPVDYVLFEAR